ncbi:MAG: hypothetical protein HYS98_03680 [Deltaproteobacteria bacterium]|nr:hypothetical protein [Deltaproteobacteria bacterium]
MGKINIIKLPSFFFQKDIFEHARSEYFKLHKKNFEKFQLAVEKALEMLILPFYMDLQGQLYRSALEPVHANVLEALRILDEGGYEFGIERDWPTLRKKLEDCSLKTSQMFGIPNDFEKKWSEFQVLIVEKHPLYVFWDKRKTLMQDSLSASYRLKELDLIRFSLNVKLSQLYSEKKTTEDQLQSLKSNKWKIIEEKRQRVSFVEDEKRKGNIINEYTKDVFSQEEIFSKNLGDIDSKIVPLMNELLGANAQWIALIMEAPYLLANVTNQSMDEFLRKPIYFYEVLVGENVTAAEYSKKEILSMREDKFQKYLDKALLAALQNMDQTIIDVARRNTYEEKLELLMNPYIETELFKVFPQSWLQDLFSVFKKEYEERENFLQTKEMILRYGSIPVVILGSLFLTGGVGTLFFIGGILYLDVTEYSYVYVRDYQDLHKEYSALTSHVSGEDAQFGRFEHYKKLQRELYGFEDPQGFFQTMESFGSVNWLHFFVFLDALSLIRPVKVTKKLLQPKKQ